MSEQSQQDWTPEHGDRSIVAFLSAQVGRLEQQLDAERGKRKALVEALEQLIADIEGCIEYPENHISLDEARNALVLAKEGK
jgi:hypothetical protein